MSLQQYSCRNTMQGISHLRKLAYAGGCRLIVVSKGDQQKGYSYRVENANVTIFQNWLSKIQTRVTPLFGNKEKTFSSNITMGGRFSSNKKSRTILQMIRPTTNKL
jgi:hypothetical protein